MSDIPVTNSFTALKLFEGVSAIYGTSEKATCLVCPTIDQLRVEWAKLTDMELDEAAVQKVLIVQDWRTIGDTDA